MVVKSWGNPSKVDVAGDPKNQNERWTFYEKNKVKRVYFEKGLVNGWDIN